MCRPDQALHCQPCTHTQAAQLQVQAPSLLASPRLPTPSDQAIAQTQISPSRASWGSPGRGPGSGCTQEDRAALRERKFEMREPIFEPWPPCTPEMRP